MFFSNKPFLSLTAAVILLPFTVIYYIAVTARNFLYDIKLLGAYRPSVFTISVGNITAGGTGKTPTVISLVNSLSEKGHEPAVVTRGYGRKSSGRIIVDRDTPASISGDEPLVIFRKTGKKVVCDKNRTAAVKALEGLHDTVVLDDAFQHRKIVKDIDIVLIDESRFLGNRLVLPSGILRDSASRLRHCDIIIISKVKDIGSDSVVNKINFLKKYGKIILISRISPCFISDGSVKTSPEALKDKKISLFCGIGNPSDFFDMFKEYEVTDRKAFPDHYSYDDPVKSFGVLKKNSGILITTYKDFVKLSPETVKEYNIHYADIELEFYDGDMERINIAQIRDICR